MVSDASCTGREQTNRRDAFLCVSPVLYHYRFDLVHHGLRPAQESEQVRIYWRTSANIKCEYTIDPTIKYLIRQSSIVNRKDYKDYKVFAFSCDLCGKVSSYFISASRGRSFPMTVNQRPTDKSTSSPRSICPSLPLHLSSFSLSYRSFRQPFPFLHLPFPFLHLPCPFHVRQERPKKGRQEFHLYFSA